MTAVTRRAVRCRRAAAATTWTMTSPFDRGDDVLTKLRTGQFY
jgi:hypothetical protein